MAKHKRIVREEPPERETPAELPEPMPEPEPEPEPEQHGETQVADAVEPAEPPAAEDTSYRAAHGADSIVERDGDERGYFLWRDGRRYVHVGEHGDRWVYRPD